MKSSTSEPGLSELPFCETTLLEGHFTPKNLVQLWQKSLCFQESPSKIRINPFVLKKSRTLFPMSELVPLDSAHIRSIEKL